MGSYRRAWTHAVVVFLCVLSFASAARTQTRPTFSLVDSDIVLDSGVTEGRGSMLLKADNLDAAGMAKQIESIADLDAPQPPLVAVTFNARELDRGTTTRRWVLTVDVKGLSRNITQKRYLSFQFNGQDVTLPYTLSNKFNATFVWSVKGPPGELSLGAGEPVEVSIAVQAVRDTKVRLLQASLVEQSRKTLLPGGLILCQQRTDACTDEIIELGPNSSNRLWLRSSANSTIVGKYVGTVSIGAAEKPDGDTFNLTIYGTTFWRQLSGVLIILFGVVCAWIITTWFQSRVNRAQLLLPAAALADRVRLLQQRLGRAPPESVPANRANTQTALSDLAQGLSEQGLDAHNYLPSTMPNPYRAMTPDITQYKQFLDRAGQQVALFDILVDEGFEAAWKKLPSAPNPPSIAALAAACRNLDGLAAAQPAPAIKDLISSIRTILHQLDVELAAANNRAAPPGLAPDVPPKTRSFEQLSIEIRNLSGLTWLVFGLLATAVGTYILIINNLGFGLPGDYFTCLFWGFGLPVSGQQLIQSTVGSIGTTLGITVPKST